MPNEPISAFEHGIIHALEELRRGQTEIRSILFVLSTKGDLRRTERQIIQSIQNQLSADDIKLLGELEGIMLRQTGRLERLDEKMPKK